MPRTPFHARLTLALPLSLAAIAWALAPLPSAARQPPAKMAMCPQLPLAADLPTLVQGPEDGPVHLSADDVSLDQDGISRLLGSVRLQQGGREFSTQALNYDSHNRDVQVRAESIFRSRQISIKSQSADFNLDSETGVFSSTLFTLPARAARGTADRLQLAREGSADLSGVAYTTCGAGSNAWYIKAGSVHLDHDRGIGSATNARLVLGGIPVLYVPYFRFPIDNRRTTGLLFPTIGNSNTSGFDMRAPLYINLAPNFDDTLTPHYMSKRGTQVINNFRYLFESSEGHLDYEYLNEDRVTQTTRHFVEFQHDSLINRRLALDVHVADASDQQYFEDLGSTHLDAASLTYLDRSAKLTYQAPAAYTITALVQDYQTIDTTLVASDLPYRRSPEIRFDALTQNSLYNARAGFSGEFDNFTRSDSVHGARLDLLPYLRMEKDDIGWYTATQLDVRYTGYQLSDTAPGQRSAPQRTLPTFSSEGGLRFERITDNGSMQTLEPRLMYLYTPYRNQDQLPLFDSGEPDFDITQLFARNRFSGVDRIGDANQAALGMTSRLLDPDTGLVRLTTTIGQLYRFEAPRVNLPGFVSPGQGATDFIAAADYQLTQRWAASVNLQWAPGDRKFNRTNFAVRYREDNGGKRLDLAYRYRQNILEQTDMIASLPLFNQWRVAGRWRYSIANSRSLDALAGIEYDTCCWALRTSYRRYIASASGKYNSAIYLQLELKGLARIGGGFDGLLPLNDTLPR